MNVIKKVALAVFKDRKVMFVRSHKNENTFYNVGGKFEEGETDVDCLVREVKEEVNSELDRNTIKFLHEFETEAHGKENTMLNIRLYSGELLHEPKPSSEIAEIKYFDSSASEDKVTIMGKAILDWLQEHNYID
jgi:8-oxo-dGTP pyrophosphatase MutT (NUDIX family)